MTSKTLPRPSSTNEQVQEYITAVRKGVNSQFVVQTADGWSVQPALEPSKGKTYSSKDEALQKAKAVAKTKRGEVFVFNRNGDLIEQA